MRRLTTRHPANRRRRQPRTEGAAQLHRSRKPHPQDQGRLHPGLQRAGRGRRSRADHRGAHAQQQRQRPDAVRSAARRHQSQPGRNPDEVSADAGYCSAANLRTLSRRRIKGYIATGRQKHGSKSATAKRPAKPGSLLARMTTRLRRAGHRSRYRLRKQVVEPVFGQIKEARGFRQFLLRGIEKVKAEWAMICTAHNLRKLALAAA